MNDPLDVPDLTEEKMEWMADALGEIEETALEDEDIHPVNFNTFLEAWVARNKKTILATYTELGVPIEVAATVVGADVDVAEVAREDLPEDLAEELDEVAEAATPEGGGVIDAEDIPDDLMDRVLEAVHGSDETDDPRGYQ